jgi:hypothetical protein
MGPLLSSCRLRSVAFALAGACLISSAAAAQRKRIRGTPRDRALGIQPVEIAESAAAGSAVPAAGRAGRHTLRSARTALPRTVEVVLVEDLIQSNVEGCAALRGNAWVATHIDACFACRFRLPIDIGDSVGTSVRSCRSLRRFPRRAAFSRRPPSIHEPSLNRQAPDSV